MTRGDIPLTLSHQTKALSHQIRLFHARLNHIPYKDVVSSEGDLVKLLANILTTEYYRPEEVVWQLFSLDEQLHQLCVAVWAHISHMERLFIFKTIKK